MFYTILGFTSHSEVIGDIPGFVQLIPGKYKIDKTINIRGIGKVQVKCNCINESIVKGTREPVLYIFALSSPPGHKINKEPRIKFLKR